jgi:hypothetical protein
MGYFQNPVVFIPGITASTLHDVYPLKTEDVWSMVFHQDYDRISMHPDNVRFEAQEPARIISREIFSIYGEMIKQLKYELSESQDKPTPVFPFPYDWRQPIQNIQPVLKEFIDEVIERTKLLRHYSDYGDVEKVDIVAHSMGGLLLCEYLYENANDHRIGKIATMGTPFQGSIEAIAKLTSGMSLLAGDIPSERKRESARITPAVYQLLPSYTKSVIDTDGKNIDIFDPQKWQMSIIQSLAEYVRLHSVTEYKTKTKQKNRAEKLLKDFLNSAKSQRNNVKKLNLTDLGLEKNGWQLSDLVRIHVHK